MKIRTFLLFAFVFGLLSLGSQTNTIMPGFAKTNDLFGTRCFIENKGQFRHPNSAKETVQFVYEHFNQRIYFTPEGLLFEEKKSNSIEKEDEGSETEREREKARGDGSEAEEFEKHYVKLQWLNSLPMTQFSCMEKTSHYFTYGDETLNAYGYKILLYKNLYPNIDLEFTLPPENEKGIKYSLIVHPGGDLDDVKYQFVNAGKPSLSESGDLLVPFYFSELKETKPIIIDSEANKINCEFKVQGKTISFLPESTPIGTYTLDPWLIYLNTAPFTNATDVDYDNFGNVYIYGNSPQASYRSSKYNSVGTLLWTFTSLATAPFFGSSTYWRAGIATDRSAGKLFCATIANPDVIRLNAAGNYDNFVSIGMSGFYLEGGDLLIDCNGNLVNFGGVNASGQLINGITGSITISTKFQPSANTCCFDIVDYAMDAAGNIFAQYGSGILPAPLPLHDYIFKIGPNFTTTAWQAPSTYSVFNEFGNEAYFGAFGSGTWFNSLAANLSYVYYYDGLHLAAYNKNTGALQGSVTVGGAGLRMQAGIAVDECNTVYVGGQGSLHCFNFNGSSFTSLGTFALPNLNSSHVVYDLLYQPATNFLYAVGANFVDVLAAPYSGSCFTKPCACIDPTISVVTSSSNCQALGNATVNVVGLAGPYNCVWMPSGLIGQTVSGLPPGAFTVVVSSPSVCVGQYAIVGNYNVAWPPVTVSVTPSNISCASLGTATISVNNVPGAMSYTWLPIQQTGSVATNLIPGNYSVVVNSSSCNVTFTQAVTFTSTTVFAGTVSHSDSLFCNGVATGTASIPNLSGGTNFTGYLWSNGTQSYTTAAPAGLSAGIWSVSVTDLVSNCSFGQSFYIAQPPTLSLLLSTSATTICVGDTVELYSLASGGVPAYTYSWSNSGNTSSTSAAPNTAGAVIYSLTAADAKLCSLGGTVGITAIPYPVLSISHASVCPQSTATLMVNGASSYSWNTAVGASTHTILPTQTGTLSVSGQSQACTSAGVASVTVFNLPQIQLQTNSPVCENSNLTFSASGGAQYAWLGPNNFSATSSAQVFSSASTSLSGTYSLDVWSAQGCKNSTTFTVLVNPTPTVSAAGSTVCVGQNFSLSATSSAASSFQWLGPQNFSSAQLFPQSLANSLAASGVYTVVVAAASSCTAYASANVLVVPVPVPSVALSSSSICANNYNNSTNQIVISAQGANQYTITAPTFFGGGALNTNSALLIYAGPNAAPSQVAMGTISGNNGYCSGSSTFSLMVYANPTINFVTVTPSICVGKTATASVSGGSSYVWQCSSAYTAQSTAGSTIITVPNSQVFYTVTAYNSGCASLSQYTSTIVYAPPQLQITPPQSSICLGEGIWLSGVGNATEYQWLPSTNFLGSATQSIFVMPQTSASYSLIAGINSCTALTVAQVSILPLPTPSIVASATSVCSGDKVILLAPGSYSYEWRMPKGSVSTGSLLNLVLSSPDDAGEYTLTAINSANCRASKTIKLLVNPKPFLHLSPFVESACAPYCTTFSADTSFTYIKIKNWQLNNKSVYTKNLSACFSVASIYTFAAIFSDTRSNCFSSKEFSIHIHPKPFANFTFEPSQPVEGMDIVNFTETSSGEQINTWQWHQPDAPIFEGPRFTRSFENAGSYPVSLMVSTSNNCKDTITKTIQVESDFALYVPNSFSPNNDGKNDVFQPIIRAGRNYTLQIFSRWGQELFSTTDISGNWDGRYRNEDCKQDVYQWTLQITTSSGNRISKTGTVLLMR